MGEVLGNGVCVGGVAEGEQGACGQILGLMTPAVKLGDDGLKCISTGRVSPTVRRFVYQIQ